MRPGDGPVRVGAIGCGSRIRLVLGHVVAAGCGRVRVVALADPHPGSIETSHALFPEATVEPDAAALVARADVDWVAIGSWNCQHREHAETALRAGKHVFCEKPLATTTEDALAIREAHRQACLRVRADDGAGVARRGEAPRFALGLVLRYSPHYQRIREVLQDGALGRVVSMEFNETLHFDHGGYIHGDWRRWTAQAGSHMLEKCCHDLDLAMWLLEDRPRRVASFGGRGVFVPENRGEVERVGPHPNGRPAFSSWSRVEDADPFTAEKDIVDHQVAILEFEGGLRATFHTNCCTNLPERRMVLCGTRGTLRADVLTGTIELARIGYDTKVERLDTGAKGGHGGADETLAAGLVATMTRGAPPLAGIAEGLRATAVANAIDEAMATGRVVDLKPLWERIDA